MSPTFRALRIRNYRLYAVGGVVSNTGTWMQRVAQDWLVLVLHHGSAADASAALGVTTGLQFLPILLFSAYAGLVADRMPKRRLLQLTQAWMGLVAVALAALALTGVVESWMVFVCAFLFGLGAAFDAPARQSFVSEMVGPDDLTNAVGLNSASFNLARVVGPALSGFLIALLGSGERATGVVILANGLSYLAVISALRLMRESELSPVPRAPRGKGMVRDGIRYVRSRPDLKMVLMAGFFAGTFGMNFQMTSALMATQVFHKGSGEYGLLGSTLALGSLTAALLGARRVGKPRPHWVIGAGLAFGTIEIGLGLMPTYLAFALCTPLLGLSLLTMLNSANTTVQLSTDPSMRGRVMALYMMLVMGGTPIGAPIVGWVGATFGARWTLIGGGAMSVFGVLLAAALFGGGTSPARWRRLTSADAEPASTLAA
ncbi:MFS transporter [Nocardioides marmorisolisilvae]|uniref:MFS transporter n=1 Tax=Nocardioides marmorisolisilvae TaxID=1542737 RepID=A0A3N0DNT5_9ACTN|nr:MFS transporter [Nocardioides marmorisolisilvae]RNL77317.1 MFS transporter [Nocardioides marmorisolisilvae]